MLHNPLLSMEEEIMGVTLGYEAGEAGRLSGLCIQEKKIIKVKMGFQVNLSIQYNQWKLCSYIWLSFDTFPLYKIILLFKVIAATP